MHQSVTNFYVIGSNQHAQLGVQEKWLHEPKPINFGVRVLHVACGAYFSVLLLESGEIYGMGYGLSKLVIQPKR